MAEDETTDLCNVPSWMQEKIKRLHSLFSVQSFIAFSWISIRYKKDEQSLQKTETTL